MTGKTHARLERRRSALIVLRQRYPALFTSCVPLAVNIHEALSADLGGMLSQEQIKDALGLWCSSKGYRRCLKAGVARFDLVGEKAGAVSKDAERHARISPYHPNKKQSEPVFSEKQAASAEPRV